MVKCYCKQPPFTDWTLKADVNQLNALTQLCGTAASGLIVQASMILCTAPRQSEHGGTEAHALPQDQRKTNESAILEPFV